MWDKICAPLNAVSYDELWVQSSTYMTVLGFISLTLMLLVFGPCCCIQSMKMHNGKAYIRKACIKSSSKSKQVQTGFIWWEYFSQCCSSSMHPMSPRLFLLWSWSVCVTVVALCVWHHCNVFCAKETLAQREREREFQKLCPCSKDFPLKRFMWFVGAKAGVAAAAQLSSQKLTSSEPIPKPVPLPVTKKASAPKVIDLNANQVCKHKGCGNTFTEKENHSTACHYHPGPAVFHDRSKGVKHAMPDCPWNICVEMYECQSLIHNDILRSQSCCLLDNVPMQFLC